MPAVPTIAADAGPSRVAAVEPTFPGRITVRERALLKVAEEASANSIGVDRRDVDVSVAEYGAGIAVRVSAPLPIPDLDDTVAVSAGMPILTRLGEIQHQLRDRIGYLTGRDVARVDITITGATIPVRRRVR